MARPRLAADHVGLIHALVASSRLRRRLVARTRAVPAGTVLRVARRRVEVRDRLGHGMVGVVYRVTEGERALALKRAGAPLGLFAELLRAERVASRAASDALAVAGVVTGDRFALLKRLVEGPTLQRLIVTGADGPAHRRALCEVIAATRALLADGLHLDPSPKNLIWDGRRLVLVDPGQPLVRQQAAEAMWRDGSFRAYVRFHAPKLQSARSEPSALQAQAREPSFEAVARWSFLRDFELWLPHLEGPPSRELLADVDPARGADEILYDMRRTGAGWQMSTTPAAAAAPGSHARALREWRALAATLPPSAPAPPSPSERPL